MSPQNIGVRVEGLAQLQAMMAQAPTMVEAEIKQAMTESVLGIQSEAMNLVPVKTGTLRRSLTQEVKSLSGGVQGIVGTNIEYGPYVELGTGIYGPQKTPIVPVNAKALAWQGSGGMIFRRSVKGRPATPYLKPAFENKRLYVEERFKAALQRVLGRLASGS